MGYGIANQNVQACTGILQEWNLCGALARNRLAAKRLNISKIFLCKNGISVEGIRQKLYEQKALRPNTTTCQCFKHAKTVWVTTSLVERKSSVSGFQAVTMPNFEEGCTREVCREKWTVTVEYCKSGREQSGGGIRFASSLKRRSLLPPWNKCCKRCTKWSPQQVKQQHETTGLFNNCQDKELSTSWPLTNTQTDEGVRGRQTWKKQGEKNTKETKLKTWKKQNSKVKCRDFAPKRYFRPETRPKICMEKCRDSLVLVLYSNLSGFWHETRPQAGPWKCMGKKSQEFAAALAT